MSEPLTVIARFRAKPGQESRALETLRALVEPTRAESGCINYDLHQSIEDPAFFVFYENWESVEHLEEHSQSQHLQALRKIQTEIFAGPPEVTRWRAVR
jgi:quinol monooxygenase YgiN